ncbi:unnamed protein product [Ceratitis capitata]|uniref:(Mediterranean fruit fly) hypothetical protein n=1 Tax=Ceratitis capitata TaxID=7213 RepID=A0A811UQW0_CERCA|nr:unnamed protein product [Ceratitis capitata]
MSTSEEPSGTSIDSPLTQQTQENYQNLQRLLSYMWYVIYRTNFLWIHQVKQAFDYMISRRHFMSFDTKDILLSNSINYIARNVDIYKMNLTEAHQQILIITRIVRSLHWKLLILV